jgi:hypothetical protein
MWESQECVYHAPDYTSTIFEVPEGSRIVGLVDEKFKPAEP